jgi:hypothetical protein
MTDKNNDADVPLGQRDISLEQIRKQLIAKEKLLRSKEDELLKKGKDNEYLNHVYEEYKSHSKKIQKEKENLTLAMKNIINHLDDIVKLTKLTKEDLTEIREEKKEIVKSMNRISKEL